MEPVNYFVKVFTNVMKKLFPSKSLAKDTISGDSIEGKLVTAVNELKGGPDCGNATEESEKDAEVEKTDYTKGAAEMNVAQILHGAADEYLSHIHLCRYGVKYSCFTRDL